MEEGIYWPTFFFLLSSATACFFAFMVLVTTNIVRMAFYLVLSLASTSGLFFLAGQDFVGAMQLMIYVGGTLVLLIFGVMLTSQERFVRMHTSGGDWVLSLLVGGGLCAVLVLTALGVPEWQAHDRATVEALELENTATPIGMGLLGARVDSLSVEDEVQRGGMGGYLLFFEIVSVHLLVVLVGAAYLARAKRKKQAAAV